MIHLRSENGRVDYIGPVGTRTVQVAETWPVAAAAQRERAAWLEKQHGVPLPVADDAIQRVTARSVRWGLIRRTQKEGVRLIEIARALHRSMHVELIRALALAARIAPGRSAGVVRAEVDRLAPPIGSVDIQPRPVGRP